MNVSNENSLPSLIILLAQTFSRLDSGLRRHCRIALSFIIGLSLLGHADVGQHNTVVAKIVATRACQD